MATEQTNGTSHASIKVSYASPKNTNTLTQSVIAPQPTDTKSKAAYINALRSATETLQDDINSFLTVKMEEDKQAAADTENSAIKHKSRDEEEEENYGEEKVDED